MEPESLQQYFSEEHGYNETIKEGYAQRVPRLDIVPGVNRTGKTTAQAIIMAGAIAGGAAIMIAKKMLDKEKIDKRLKEAGFGNKAEITDALRDLWTGEKFDNEEKEPIVDGFELDGNDKIKSPQTFLIENGFEIEITDDVDESPITQYIAESSEIKEQSNEWVNMLSEKIVKLDDGSAAGLRQKRKDARQTARLERQKTRSKND